MAGAGPDPDLDGALGFLDLVGDRSRELQFPGPLDQRHASAVGLHEFDRLLDEVGGGSCRSWGRARLGERLRTTSSRLVATVSSRPHAR
jgi:hypothetical protein